MLGSWGRKGFISVLMISSGLILLNRYLYVEDFRVTTKSLTPDLGVLQNGIRAFGYSKLETRVCRSVYSYVRTSELM